MSLFNGVFCAEYLI